MKNITITSPKQIYSVSVKKQIKALIDEGYKTNQIFLVMEFITDKPETIGNYFRVLKNRAAYDKREREGGLPSPLEPLFSPPSPKTNLHPIFEQALKPFMPC